MTKKSYNQQLTNSEDMPRIAKLTDPKLIDRFGGPRLLIAPPLAYDEIMREVPEGKVITADSIRGHLAKKHCADNTCPLTAGIFINLVAKASDERGTDPTPYWRTLKKDGELNEKFPCGIEAHKLRLEKEGHTVIQKGKRFFVADYREQFFEIQD